MSVYDRREFLRRSGRLVLGVVGAAVASGISGCGVARVVRRSPTTTSLPTSTTASETTVPTTTVPATTTTTLAGPRTIAALAGALDGHLVTPADPGYGDATLVYDLRFADAHPLAVAYSASPTDVARCIEFARHAGVVPIPRCGGHSYGGYSTGSGLVIDVTAMSGTHFDPTAGRATVGGGTLLVDLYAGCAAAGVLIPGGSCPTVGIAGLTLGGGVGVLGRKYGLTCDNLTGVEIVTADGTIVHCSPDVEPDLFWACQGGGGGNFGIVTSFEFQTHPIPALALFTCEWPWAAAGTVLAAWQRWIADAPDELWSNCQLLYEGTDGPHIRTSGVFVGAAADLGGLVRSLIADAGAPTAQSVTTDTFLGAMLAEAGCTDLSIAQCHLPGQTADAKLDRATFTAKSAYLGQPLPPAGIAAVTATIDRLGAEGAEVGAALIFDALGGAINAVAPDATAFVHRDALCSIQLTSTVDGESQWLRSAAAAIAPYANGQAYQNYIDPDLDGWADAYYGTNLARLSRVKRAFDPDDTFHFAQSVPLG